MVLSLGLGVVAGPMITDWLSEMQMSSEESIENGATGEMTQVADHEHTEGNGGWYHSASVASGYKQTEWSFLRNNR